MKRPLLLTAVLLAFTATWAGAQPPKPKACRLLIEVDKGKISDNTQQSTACEFGGKIIMMAVNLDDAEYDVVIEKFRFDATTAATCSATNPEAQTLLPINGSSNKRFTLGLGKEKAKTQKKGVRARDIHMAECYKFDIVLKNSAGVEIHRLDPELEITEPNNPPPVPPGPKKPPVQ